MGPIALRMTVRHPVRFAFTAIGLGCLFLLCLVQAGLLVGWCLTTSAIIRQAEADLWIVAERTPAFDFGAPLPAQRVYQARNVPGVAWAGGMVVKWSMWQRPDGRRISVEIVGLDRELVGGPWRMEQGDVRCLHRRDAVIIDAAYLDVLGVSGLNQEVDIYGSRAEVRGVCRDVRTFTTSPYVFTSLASSRQYGHLVRPDELTFVLVRCDPQANVNQVAQRLARTVPHVEVLTKRQFATRTAAYWMLETGAGITVLIVAVLGLLVSTLVVGQSLYSLTIDALPHYGLLKALGFSNRKLTAIVLLQATIFAAAGAGLGTLLSLLAVQWSAGSKLALALPLPLLLTLVLVYFTCCLAAAWVPVRLVQRVDPATVFRV